MMLIVNKLLQMGSTVLRVYGEEGLNCSCEIFENLNLHIGDSCFSAILQIINYFLLQLASTSLIVPAFFLSDLIKYFYSYLISCRTGTI